MPYNQQSQIMNMNEDYALAQPQSDQIDLSKIWGVIRRRFWLIVLVTAIVAGAGTVFTWFQKPVYQAQALMVVPTSKINYARMDELSSLQDLMDLANSRAIEGQISVIMSPYTMLNASNTLGIKKLEDGFGKDFNKNGWDVIPQWAVDVTTKKDSDVISVEVKAFTPQIAAEAANTIVQTYMNQSRVGSSMTARNAREYLQKEMESVRQSLQKAQKELSDFKAKTNLVVPESINTLASNATQLQIEADRAAIDYASINKQAEALESQLRKDGKNLDANETLQLNPQYQQALNRLDELNAQRAKLLADYTPISPEVRSIDEQIADAKKSLGSIAQNIVASKTSSRNPAADNLTQTIVASAAAQARQNAIASVLSARNSQINKLPEQERKLTELLQKENTLEKTYQMLSDKFYVMQINEKSTLPNALFVAQAQENPVPAYPDKKRNVALFFLLGLFVSFGVVALVEKADNKIREDRDIVRITGEVPLGVIPNQKNKNAVNLLSGDLVENNAYIESFRILRNNIVFTATDTKLKILAVTSAGRNEGKSTVAVNLAAAMAYDGKKVLLIDCDLRRPSVHKLVKNSNKVGLTNLVKGLAKVSDAVVASPLPDVFLLPSGPYPKNPAEFLNTIECRDTIKRFAEEYDMVILDCPPASGLNDMQVISTIANGVLITVTMNQSREDLLKIAMLSLSQIGAPVIGYVANRQQVSMKDYKEYYNRIEE